jgi:two-component system KDP operon response regulator KdpE
LAERLKILVADDEAQITRVLRTTLTVHGYEVHAASDGEAALALFEAWKPDLVITDLAMPKMTGIELCENIRDRSQIPIIILSVRGEEKNKVEALDKGADDYITKPFSINELLARVRATLRRGTTSREEEETAPIEIGDFHIDLETRVVAVQGKEVRLTPTEFDLLVYMARHPGKVLTHRTLLNAVWGGQNVQTIEYLWVFINQLRKKIDLQGSPHYIRTEFRIGYRFLPKKSLSLDRAPEISEDQQGTH